MDPLVSTASTQQMMGATVPLTDEEINSEAELLKSHDVLEKVVLANGLENPTGKSIFSLLHAGKTKEQRTARAVRGLADKLKVETPTKTNLIDVTYSASNPAVAYGVLNSLSDLYLEKHAAVHRPQGSYEVFSQQAQTYKDALTQSENRLRDLGEKQGVADPDEERTYLAQQLANNVGMMHATQQAIAADEQRIQSDRQQLTSTPKIENQGRYKCIRCSPAAVGKHPAGRADKTDAAAGEVRPELPAGQGGGSGGGSCSGSPRWQPRTPAS